MIKVIAFDLVGVLLTEKNIKLKEQEQKIERLFGDNLDDKVYLEDAKRILGNESDIVSVTENIFEKLYKIKYKNLIKNLKKINSDIKIIIATNHVGYIKKYIEKNLNDIDEIIISSEINMIKPNKNFYQYILNKFSINPEELLFVDDNKNNIVSASKLGINTIHVTKNTKIYNEITKILKDDINNNYYKAYETRYKQIYKQNNLWTEKQPTPDVIETINKIKKSKSLKILEVGCGEGRDAIFLLENNYDVLAIDYSNTVIKKCNELSHQKYKKNFKQLDVLKENLNEKFDFIYSIAVIHMFVNKDHRKKFLKFIYNHLTENGIALIATMGDGKQTYESDISKSFEITDRYINNKIKVKTVNTSCKIVNWEQFKKELNDNDFKVKSTWISKKVPGFDKVMFAVITK